MVLHRCHLAGVPGADLGVSVRHPRRDRLAAARQRAALVRRRRRHSAADPGRAARAVRRPAVHPGTARRGVPPPARSRATTRRLLADVPPADGSAAVAGVATRAAVRTFAVELPEDPPDSGAADRTGSIRPSQPWPHRARRPTHVGLTQSGGTLDNGTAPMTDLKRPGQFLGAAGEAAQLRQRHDGDTVRVRRPRTRLDPGAVASWWARLTTTFTNLFAPGVDLRTASVDPQLTVQLVGPAEAPASDAVLSRLEVDQPDRVRAGPGAWRGVGRGHLRAHRTATSDDAPLPLLAALPAGVYGAAVNLWAAGAVGGVTRDFVRVALVDVEQHLTGQPRVAASGANAERPAPGRGPTPADDPDPRRPGHHSRRPERAAGHRGRSDGRAGRRPGRRARDRGGTGARPLRRIAGATDPAGGRPAGCCCRTR